MRNRLKRKLHSMGVEQRQTAKVQNGLENENLDPSQSLVSNSNNAKSTEAVVNELVRNKSESSKLAGLQLFIILSREKRLGESGSTQHFGGLAAIFTKMIESPVSSDAERCLAAHSMNYLLLSTLDTDDMRKDSVQSTANKLLTVCVGLKERIFTFSESCKAAILMMVKTCVKYFGASSLPLKNRLERMIVELLIYHPGMAPTTIKTCLSTLSSLSQCGPLAVRPELYSDMSSRYCVAASYHINFLLKHCCLYDVVVKKTDDGRLIFVEGVPSSAHLEIAVHQLLIYSQCLENLLQFMKVSPKSKISVKKILELICDMTNVSLKSKTLNRQSVEMSVFRTALPGIHKQALALLSALFTLMKRETLLYGTTIAQVIQDELLYSTSDLSDSLVDLLRSILTQSAAADVLTATPQLQNRVVKFILEQKRSVSVMRVIELLLLHSTRDMSKSSHHSLYSWISQTGAFIHEIYEPAVRAQYYSCVKASLNSYSSKSGPLTNVAVKILAIGDKDQSEQVREICYNALHSDVVNVTQPVCPPLAVHQEIPDLLSLNLANVMASQIEVTRAEESTNRLLPDSSLQNATAPSRPDPIPPTPHQKTKSTQKSHFPGKTGAAEAVANVNEMDVEPSEADKESGVDDGASDEDDDARDEDDDARDEGEDEEVTIEPVHVPEEIEKQGTRNTEQASQDEQKLEDSPEEEVNSPAQARMPLSAEMTDMLQTFVDGESENEEDGV